MVLAFAHLRYRNGSRQFSAVLLGREFPHGSRPTTSYRSSPLFLTHTPVLLVLPRRRDSRRTPTRMYRRIKSLADKRSARGVSRRREILRSSDTETRFGNLGNLARFCRKQTHVDARVTFVTSRLNRRVARNRASAICAIAPRVFADAVTFSEIHIVFCRVQRINWRPISRGRSSFARR